MLDIRQLWPEKREEWNLWTGNLRQFARRCRNCGGRNTRPRTLRQSSGNLGDLRGEGSKQEQEHVSCLCGDLENLIFWETFSCTRTKATRKMWGFFSLDWKDILKILGKTMRAGKRLGGLLLCQACENNIVVIVIIIVIAVIILLLSPSSMSSSTSSIHHHIPLFVNSRYILQIMKCFFLAGLNLCQNQLKTLLMNKSYFFYWHEISNWSWVSTGASLLSAHGKEWKSWVKYFVSFQVSKYGTNIFTPLNMRWICSRCKILHEYAENGVRSAWNEGVGASGGVGSLRVATRLDLRGGARHKYGEYPNLAWNL